MIRAVLRRILLILITLPFTLILLEIGIRVAAPQPVEDLAYEDIYTERYSPALTRNVIALVPGITRYKNNAEVHINNDGNRDYEYPFEKTEGVKRIAIVGSSVAFGFNLRLEDSFGKQLESQLNDTSKDTEFEVLLFGRPGFKIKETYAYVKDVVFDYGPDLIVYSFVQNNYDEQSPVAFFSNQEDSANSVQNDGVNSLLSVIRKQWGRIRDHTYVQYFRSHFHLYLFSTNAIVPVLRDLSPTEKEKAQNIAPLFPDTRDFKLKVTNTEAWISLMNEECKNRKIKFAILMHPYEMQLNLEGTEKWRSTGIPVPEDALNLKTHLLMKEFAEKERIFYLDVVPALRSYSREEDLYMPGDYGHYSFMGHKVIAEFLVKEIIHALK